MVSSDPFSSLVATANSITLPPPLVLAMRKYGRRHTLPFLLSLALEYLSYSLRNSARRAAASSKASGPMLMSEVEKNEESRRKRAFVWYLVRGPVWEGITKSALVSFLDFSICTLLIVFPLAGRPRLEGISKSFENKPIIGYVSTLIQDYIPLLDKYHFCEYLTQSCDSTRNLSSSLPLPLPFSQTLLSCPVAFENRFLFHRHSLLRLAFSHRLLLDAQVLLLHDLVPQMLPTGQENLQKLLRSLLLTTITNSHPLRLNRFRHPIPNPLGEPKVTLPFLLRHPNSLLLKLLLQLPHQLNQLLHRCP